MWHSNVCLTLPVLVLILSPTQGGEEPDYIVFPHQLHVEEMELDCDQCHEGISSSLSLTTRLLPDKDTCLDCHDGDTATDECFACHNNTDDPGTYGGLYKRAGPTFSHLLHLAKESDCLDCHAHISYDDGLAPPSLWRGDDCRACHEKTPPDNHTLDWSRIHGLTVNSITEQNCVLCHSQVTCDNCHQLQQFEPKVHSVSYILSHGFDARAAVTDCSTCHHIGDDCRQCHRQNHIWPMDHNLANWVQLPSLGERGGLHSEEAMSEPEVCIACHEPAAEACTGCHGG